MDAKSKPGNEGQSSRPQTQGEHVKASANDMRPEHEAHAGQPGALGQRDSDREQSQQAGFPDGELDDIGIESLGRGIESPMMNQSQESGAGMDVEDADEDEDAQEKEPFRDGQSSHPGSGHGV